MAGPIKLFQFFQNCQQTIGIDQFEQDQKKRSINSTRMIFLISFAQLMLTMIAFLAFEAESIIDYGFTFWAITCLINGCGNYSIFIWQSENTLKFIEDCEAFIEKVSSPTSDEKRFTHFAQLHPQIMTGIASKEIRMNSPPLFV